MKREQPRYRGAAGSPFRDQIPLTGPAVRSAWQAGPAWQADPAGPAGQAEPAGPDLADMVVHRLFGVGRILESAADSAAGLADVLLAYQLGQALDELDDIIRDVRTAVFGLRDARRPPG